MSKILILDTETTDKVDGEVIELAYIEVDYPLLDILSKEDFFFKPTKPIAYGAKAVHHILESDLVDKEEVGSEAYKTIINDIAKADYFIGHNIDFDWKAIGSPDVKRIDTLAIARKLLPDLDSHTQSALMYYFFGYSAREMIRNAHNALCDVENCLKVLSNLIFIYNSQNDFETTYYERVKNIDTIKSLWLFSEYCRIPDKLTFGKHFGKTFLEVAKNDPSYFDWMRYKSGMELDEYTLKAITTALENRRK